MFKLFSGLMVSPQMIADLKTNGECRGTVVNTEAYNKLKALLGNTDPNAERLLFEKIAKDDGHSCMRNPDGAYNNVYLQAAWQGWQECVQAHDTEVADLNLDVEQYKRRIAELEKLCRSAKELADISVQHEKEAGHHCQSMYLVDLLIRMDRSGI